MFPKDKIDHKSIVNMGTTVNYTKGIIKEALFVGCLDPTEEIKICRIAESWAKDAPSWKELNGRNKIKNVAAMCTPTKQTSTEEMKSHQLKNLLGIVSENQIWENTSLWPDSVQQWFFCIPSSIFVNLTKFTTGAQNGIYLSRNISPFECSWNNDFRQI